MHQSLRGLLLDLIILSTYLQKIRINIECWNDMEGLKLVSFPGNLPFHTEYINCLFITPEHCKDKSGNGLFPTPTSCPAERCHCQFPTALNRSIPFPRSQSSNPKAQPCKKTHRGTKKLGTANDEHLPHSYYRAPIFLADYHWQYQTNGRHSRPGPRSNRSAWQRTPLGRLRIPTMRTERGNTFGCLETKKGGPSYNFQTSLVTLACNVILRCRNGRGSLSKFLDASCTREVRWVELTG